MGSWILSSLWCRGCPYVNILAIAGVPEGLTIIASAVLTRAASNLRVFGWGALT